jgi:ABC-type transport system substrate-binding protein
MKSSRKAVLVLWMLSAMLLAACGQASAGALAPTEEPTAEPPLVADGASTATTAAPPQPLDLASPTARRGLEATDPTTVRLDAGRPTLVEFFAFW